MLDIIVTTKMARKILIAANWKMNKSIEEAINFIDSVKEDIKDTDKEILICPAFTAIHALVKRCENTNIMIGSQNMFYEDKGAFTGEISPVMIKDLCRFVIIGHSERRQFFNETDDLVNRKLKKALEHSLCPILCIGENLEERENDKTFSVIEEQLKQALEDILDISSITIAYEPVWAIGTGKTATPEQAEEIHIFIRKKIKEMYDENIASGIRILYGGSVKPENVKELMEKENIDGALVGGASLEPESFVKLIRY